MIKIEKIFRLKYTALLISILISITGIIAIVIGSIRLIEGILVITGYHEEGKAGIYLIEAVDTYLFALVILVLGGGIFKLFVGNKDTFKESAVLSKINTFMDLKSLLWETLLLTLTVWCALSFFAEPDKMQYEQLILPVTILLLALALKFMKAAEK